MKENKAGRVGIPLVYQILKLEILLQNAGYILAFHLFCFLFQRSNFSFRNYFIFQSLVRSHIEFSWGEMYDLQKTVQLYLYIWSLMSICWRAYLIKKSISPFRMVLLDFLPYEAHKMLLKNKKIMVYICSGRKCYFGNYSYW